MLRKISFGLLCMAASVSTSSYSIQNNPVQFQGLTVEYDLIPNQPQTFTNYMFWAVEANCKIITPDPDGDILRVVAIAKKGKVNETPIVAGQALEVRVFAAEILKINADSGAKVEITNLGLNTVKASCIT